MHNTLLTPSVREAARRRALRAGSPSSRPLAPDYELTGVRGEDLFAREFGLEVNRFFDGPGGDRGIDFWLNLCTRAGVRRCSVDVKSAHHPNPRRLWVEIGKVNAAVYVLASIDDRNGDVLLGWATRAEVLAAPITQDHGIVHHQVDRRDLHPMNDLRRMAEAARQPLDPFEGIV